MGCVLCHINFIVNLYVQGHFMKQVQYMIQNWILSRVVHHGVLTPAYTDEHPFPQFVSGVCQYYGCVQIAALSKHPEEVGHMEIIIRCCDQPAPDLRVMREREIKLDV